MEKETKKKNTTGTKKTTSAKKTSTESKKNKPAEKTTEIKKASNTKTVTKTVKNEVATKKTNSKNSKTKTAASKKVDVKVEESKIEKVNDVPVKKGKEVKKATTKKVEKPTEEKNKKETTLGEELKSFIKSDIGSLIGIVLIIVLIMGGFFFITDFIKNLNKPEEELIASQDIQYDEILLSNMLKQPNNAYYVFIFDDGSEALDSKDIDIQTYDIYLELYEGKENSLRLYRADLTSKFNEVYRTDKESNLIVSDIKELKVKSNTLVKVENGVVVAAFDTRTSIVEHLTSLIN